MKQVNGRREGRSEKRERTDKQQRSGRKRYNSSAAIMEVGLIMDGYKFCRERSRKSKLFPVLILLCVLLSLSKTTRVVVVTTTSLTAWSVGRLRERNKTQQSLFPILLHCNKGVDVTFLEDDRKALFLPFD